MSAVFCFFSIPCAADSVVVFNEIMYHPATNESQLEWVELHNQMAVDVDISNWYLADGIEFLFPEGTIIAGGDYIVVGIDPSALEAEGIFDAYGPFTGRLENAGERLELRNNNNRLMSSVRYREETAVAADGAGVSLAKIDPNGASSDLENWTASLEIGGTPGDRNFPSQYDPGALRDGLISYWNFDDESLGGGGGYFEDFAEPNGAPQDWYVAQGTVSIVSEWISVRAGGESCAWAGASGAPLEFSEIRSVSFRVNFAGRPTDTVGRHGGVILCADSPTNRNSSSGYIVDWIDRSTDRGYRMYKSTAGTHTFFETGSGHAEPGSQWRIEFDATGFTLFADDAQIKRCTDASYRNGHIGFWCYSNTGQDIRFDDVVVEYTGSARDSGGGGNHGEVGPDVVQVEGLVGTGAASFDNSTDSYVNAGSGNDNNFSVTSGITVEALVKSQWSGESGDYDILFAKDDGDRSIVLSFQHDGITANRDIALSPAAQPVLSFGLNRGGEYSELDMPLDGQEGRPLLGSLTDGTAHHVAAVYDGASGVKGIYVDGVLCFSAEFEPGGAIESGGTGDALIGNSEDAGQPFSGVIDEAAFWARALTQKELQLHFDNFTAGRNYFAPRGEEEDAACFIVFNETGISNTKGNWLELFNGCNTEFALSDCVLVSAGTVSAEYVFPEQTLPGGVYLVLHEADLGFDLAEGNKIFLYSPGKAQVLASVLLHYGYRGRYPDGSDVWCFQENGSPGETNSVSLSDALVISEIMYHPSGDPEEPLEYLELANRGASPIDLSAFSVSDGVSYTFPEGLILSTGGYIVIARNPERVKEYYGIDNVVGPYEGVLSNGGERIALIDAAGNPVDEVRYCDGAPWPSYADGGGSSLELRDLWADNNKSSSWSASDEAAKAAWRSYNYSGIAASNLGPTQWNELVIGLLDDGEVLLDDISVIEDHPTQGDVEFVQNGGFQSGESKWRLIGNHSHSEVIDDSGSPGNRILHLVATGPTEHMHNHAETTFANSESVVNGREYRISFRAKWLGGSNQLNTRLYFNRLPRTTLLEMPEHPGTPGVINSVFESNIGPAFSDFRHRPVVPEPTDTVTVSVKADDPDGVERCMLWWSVNGGAWESKEIAAAGQNTYKGMIPPAEGGAAVQFFVEAEDTGGQWAAFPARGSDSRALYRVNDGQAQLDKLHNLRIIMTPADTNLLHEETNVMSNDRMGATVIYDEADVYYDVGVRLRSSERGRSKPNRVGFNIGFNRDKLFRGVHRSVGIDRAGGWGLAGVTSPSQDEILIKHIVNHAGKIPGMYDDLVHTIAPRNSQTGSALLMMARFGDVFLDSQWENGSEGNVYNYELIYYPTTTVDGNPESLKRPQPDGVTGVDIKSLGGDKEVYRWFFSLENNRREDDYEQFTTFCNNFYASSSQIVEKAKEVMDVDEWMRTFCIYSLCGVNDAYTYGNYHNLKIYIRPGDGKALAFHWDLDWCWTSGTETRGFWGGNNLSRIMSRPPFARMYYRHMLDIIDTTYNRSYMDYWVQHYGDLAGQNFGGVSTYISQRRSHLLGLLSNLPVSSSFAIITENGEDFTVEKGTASVEISGGSPLEVAQIELNGELIDPEWSSISRWSIEVPLLDGANELEFVALDTYGEAIASDDITIVAGTDDRPPRFRRGDANADGGVDISDVVTILLYLFSGEQVPCHDAVDVNDDSTVDISDAVSLLAYLFAGGNQPPEPFEECGSDPTEDALDCVSFEPCD